MTTCDNIPDYIVLPAEGGGAVGPIGPIGPEGPPGIGSLPVPAADVSVTNEGYTTAQEIFDALLYVLLTITSFTATTIVFEIGSAVNSLGLSWVLNKIGITSQKIVGSHVETGVELGILARTTTITFAIPLVSSSTFTLNVNDGTNIIVKNLAINFYSGVYIGNAVVPGIVNSAFILTLSKTLQAGRGSSFASNAGVDTFVWYAHRASLGIANFNVGGFDGGFEAPLAVSFINSLGYTENYYIYRSTNPQIGTVNVTVT